MTQRIPRSIIFTLLLAGLCIGLLSSSCASAQASRSQTPAIQTRVETMVVTKFVSREVTQVVTRIVSVPVTMTPTATLAYSLTPTETPTITYTPTVSPTSQPPIVTVSENSDCQYGPGTMYLYKNNVFTNQHMEATGRNPDGSWLEIEDIGGWNSCWIQASRISGIQSEIEALPIVYAKLPHSNQYLTPDAIARRNGNEVTISWEATWRSLDDYRGYLIEAWVCQGSKQVFSPIGYYPPLSDNTGTFSIQVIDEAGCGIPSKVLIYSVDKRGYSDPGKVPWPQP